MGTDLPPDYETVMSSNGKEKRVFIPLPGRSQLGSYTNEYVTGIEPSHYPLAISTEHGIMYVREPLSRNP